MARICCTTVGGTPFACSDLSGCSINSLIDVDTITIPPAIGQVLVWDGANWAPQPSPSGNTSIVTPVLALGFWVHDDGAGTLTTIRSTAVNPANTISADPADGGSYLELSAGANIGFAGTGAPGDPLVISSVGGAGSVLVGNCLVGDGTFGNELNILVDPAVGQRLSCSGAGAYSAPEELFREWNVLGLGGITVDANAWRANSAGRLTKFDFVNPDGLPLNPTAGVATIELNLNGILIFTILWDFSVDPLFLSTPLVLAFAAGDEFTHVISSIVGLGVGEQWRNPSFVLYYTID